MKKIKVLMISLLAVFVLAACGSKVDDATADTYIQKAKEVVALLNEGQFEQITTQFDATMKTNLTAEQLAEIKPILDESGPFLSIDKQSVEQKDNMTIVVLVAKHQENKRIYTVTYDEKDQIAGLFVQ